MNQPKRNLKIWIPIAAVVCFWLGDWMGHTYELTDGTTTHRLAAALNLNSLLLHPFRLSADAFSLGCGIATALMAGLIYLCVKYSKHRLTYKSGVPYDIEQEQTGKQDKESAGPDCATICRPQDFFLNMSRTKRKRKLVEWLESCQENQVNVLDEKIPLLSFAVDFVTAYEYQKARGIKIHPGLWKDMRVDIFLVKKEN